MQTINLKTIVLVGASAFILLTLPKHNTIHRKLEINVPSLRVSSMVESSLRVVPDWVREYVEWHKEQRLHHMNDPNTKFLTVTCHKNYACGGLSDRLRALPYFILAAHKTGRVLLIHWQKFQLEDFLVPPSGGLDWRLPKELSDLGDAQPWRQPSCTKWTNPHRSCQLWDHSDPNVVNKKNIIINAREDLYADVRDEYFVTSRRPEGTYAAVMNILFQPSLGVNVQFLTTMKELGLKPRQYLAAHFRDRYPYLLDRKAKMSNEHKSHLLHNAINCVVHKSKQSDVPIYFTSDKWKNVQYLLNDSPFASKNNPPVTVVGIEDLNRENIDEGIDFLTRKPSEFYSVFVDMLIFSHSRCVSYGQGGYGLFGARMSDEQCMIQHQVVWNATDCPSLI